MSVENSEYPCNTYRGGNLTGKVAIVTGAGRGLGRAHALELARQGAKVVVNDLGTTADGKGAVTGPAQDVVEEITSMGGEAIADGSDVTDWDSAERMVSTAIDTYGDLHILVNNAGFLRDRMLVNMTIEEWDAVIRVHLRGLFVPTKHAVAHWRAQHKSGSQLEHPRIINTSSPTGVFGNIGQVNYGAAKAGVANFTINAATELLRMGVTVNAIVPSARSRMTEGLDLPIDEETGWDPFDPANVSPLVAYLASPRAHAVTGRVFISRGGKIAVARPWQLGAERVKKTRWDADELAEIVPQLLEEESQHAG